MRHFFQLIEVQKADNLAKKPFCAERIPKLENIKRTAENLIKSNSCLDIKNLAVNGNDIKNAGFSGRDIGIILKKLLDEVIENNISNEYEQLMQFVTEIKNNGQV